MGIAYYSSAQYSDYQRCTGFNIALPVFEFGEDGYCKILQRAFMMTEPKLVDLIDYIDEIKAVGEKYLREYNFRHNLINSPNWDILTAASLALKYFITKNYATNKDAKDPEAFYALVSSLRCSFHLLRESRFIDIHNNFMPTLHNAVCKVSDSLDKLLNSIIQIDCTDGAIGEKQIREQFDYIESTGLSGA